MNFSFHHAARTEFNEAIEYYENCQLGLGLEFVSEDYTAIQRIIQFPASWSPLSANTRRCLVNRFPYGVIYQTLDDQINIIAVAQLNRKPAYWVDRT